MTARLAALACALLLSSTARADVLVDNVDGLTLDAQGRVDRFTGLLIGDDGRVEQVLRRGDKRPGKVDYLVDGKGRVLMPGFVDAHADVMAVGFAALTLDLSATKSLAEAQARIAAYAAAHPDRAWILGRGWDETRWAAAAPPTAADLDSVVAGRPVWLLRTDGDAGWANTKALTLAGITATTRDPVGGRIERVSATQRPSGLLLGAATALVDGAAPPPRPEDRDKAFAEAQQALLKSGVTAVTDMGTTIADWQSYRRAGDRGALRIRVVAYAGSTDDMMLIGGPGPTPWLYDDRLRLNGVVLELDGGLATRGALLKAPYADRPAAKGDRRLTDTQLRNLMSRGAIDNFQLAVKAHGDAAVAATLDAVDELVHTYKGDRRWRIEGMDAIDPADLPRLRANGVVASVQPGPQMAARATAEARLGPARLGGAFAWKSLGTNGATLAFGSAASATAPSPFAAMADALTRQDAQGLPFLGWQPQEQLARETALAAFTTGAAHAAFAEGRFGRLAQGARADFLIVDRDPLLASPAELRETRVLETWVGGQQVWKVEGP